MSLQSLSLGKITYSEGLARQREMAATFTPENVSILYFECESVITLGLRAPETGHQVIPELRVERGGQATYHGPGQLLIFPVLHLPTWKFSVKDWVGFLLDVTRETLLVWNIESEWNFDRPGLFTVDGKIAAMGLKIRRGFSEHGLALNVAGDLGPFSEIPACGVTNGSVDQISLWHPEITFDQVEARWTEVFQRRLLSR
jgi:lipoyl(octanoyl) transferase